MSLVSSRISLSVKGVKRGSFIYLSVSEVGLSILELVRDRDGSFVFEFSNVGSEVLECFVVLMLKKITSYILSLFVVLSTLMKAGCLNYTLDKFMVGDTGIEPVTSSMSTMRSSQLS